MLDPKRATIPRACKLMLEPVVRFLLRNGFGSGVLIALCKEVFVEVASREFAIAGRKSSDSRLSILTGLSRRDVKAVKERGIQSQPAMATHSNRANRVMNGWYSDPRFVGPQGDPLSLALDGESPSFPELVKAYAGDVPSRAVLEELRRLGRVREDITGKLSPKHRIPLSSHEETDAATEFGRMVSDVGRMAANMLDKPQSEAHFFQGSILDASIDPTHLPLFRKHFEKAGTGFLEEANDWLLAHESKDGTPSASVSIYMNVAEEEKQKV